MIKFVFRLSAAVLAAAALGGCAWMPWVEADTNVKNSAALRAGMNKSEVLEAMGEPVRGESYCRPDVWFYYVKTEWADGLTTEDECMPLVFVDGKLAGWGNQFYTRYRMSGDSRAKEIVLPDE